MVSGRDTYIDMYRQKETNELLSLHHSGGLTAEAYDDLESILRNRGVEPPKRPAVLAEPSEENHVDRWSTFWPRFLGSFVLCLLASRIFLSHLPNPANVFPGSLKDIVSRLVGDSVQFITVFVAVSLLIVVFSKVRKSTRRIPIPILLEKAVIVTLSVEALMIYGLWYATTR